MAKKKEPARTMPPLFWIVILMAVVIVAGFYSGAKLSIDKPVSGSATSAGCVDIDGANPFVRGYATDAAGTIYWDRCFEDFFVTERVCAKDGKVRDLKRRCSNLCEEGACKRTNS